MLMERQTPRLFPMIFDVDAKYTRLETTQEILEGIGNRRPRKGKVDFSLWHAREKLAPRPLQKRNPRKKIRGRPSAYVLVF